MVQFKFFFRFVLLWIFAILIFNTLLAQKPKRHSVLPDKFCVSSDEFILAKMINDYRRQNNLPVVPLSNSLFFVARSHVQDLALNHPDRYSCGLHSWSDKGDWNPCCYGKEAGKTGCMNDKPKELTGYKGKGFEMIYWGSETAVPADAIDVWKSTTLTNEMMLNKGKWKTRGWKSLGVGLVDGYASVWFGDETDQSKGFRLCTSDSLVDSQTLPTTLMPVNSNSPEIKDGPGEYHYFLITASFKTRQQADQQVSTHIKQGFQKATIIEKDNVFRVAVTAYNSQEKAQKALNKLSSRFKGIWILQN
jgi:hypothetical protein